jgi:RNA polymerase sigma-70 factor (ECF subfamily)
MSRRPFRPWLLRIVTRLAFNSRRSAGRRAAARERYEAAADRATAQVPLPESAVQAGEEARSVWAAVGTLGRDDQTVLYLRYFLDASEEEVAAAIGRPVGTVKSRLHRALQRLRAVVEERFPDLILEHRLRNER